MTQDSLPRRMDDPCGHCGGTGIRDKYFMCETCRGVGPFDESFPGQPPWKKGERYRYVNNTKVYRCYAEYIDD